MIIVHGSIPIVPERREQALELAREMSDATQLEQGFHFTGVNWNRDTAATRVVDGTTRLSI